jgi:murein tripeptide amidase MpaA
MPLPDVRPGPSARRVRAAERGARTAGSAAVALASLIVAGAVAGSRPAERASPAAETAILPPALPWDGTSRSLVASPDDPWVTPAEASGFARTPRYDETVAWLLRLVEVAPDLEMVSLGKSHEGRHLWMVIASADRAFTPEALRATGKPTLLAQGGIHSGEIDGKDAGLMFLRDLSGRGTKHALLDRANFLFVPIFNVDGHERFSRFGRMNQRGPDEIGWRTTARNLNLNRDYMKLDAPEMRAMVRALDEWAPDLYFDIHVTDGIDYQYDITFGYTGRHGHSPAGARWMDEKLRPTLERDLRAMGHIPGPLIFPMDNNDLAKGIVDWTADPRFSHGYGDARHLPTVLVENHSLKPYDQRVLGTYVLLESALRAIGANARSLRAAIAADRAARPKRIPLAWRPPEAPSSRSIEYLGVRSRLVPSAVSGMPHSEWTGIRDTLRVPFIVASDTTASATRPAAYWVPAAWPEVIERLGAHGIRMERIGEERTLDVEVYRIDEPELETEPFEGRVRVTGAPAPERRRVRFAPGSVRVPTDQPLGDLAVLLLEPRSPDSFFQWGFFLEILQRTEYVEEYVIEPMAERMLAADSTLRASFEKKLLEDGEFAGSAHKRLEWFYERTPFYDGQWRIYPVAREVKASK